MTAPRRSPTSTILKQPLKAAQARVEKTMAAGAPGTLKLQKRFGPDLMTVRYRYDWARLFRFTTVELVVARQALEASVRNHALFALRIGRHERDLLSRLKAQGAIWNPELQCWILPANVIQTLDIADRVELVETRG